MWPFLHWAWIKEGGGEERREREETRSTGTKRCEGTPAPQATSKQQMINHNFHPWKVTLYYLFS